MRFYLKKYLVLTAILILLASGLVFAAILAQSDNNTSAQSDKSEKTEPKTSDQSVIESGEEFASVTPEEDVQALSEKLAEENVKSAPPAVTIKNEVKNDAAPVEKALPGPVKEEAPKAAEIIKKQSSNFTPRNKQETVKTSAVNSSPAPAVISSEAEKEPAKITRSSVEVTLKSSDKKHDKNELVKTGKRYYKDKDYESAIKTWEGALAFDPENKKIMKYIRDAQEKNRRKIEREKKLIKISSPPDNGLGQLKLNDCIRIAIKNHIPLQVAEKNVKLGEMRIKEAFRNLLPTASVTWQEYYGRVQGRRYFGRKQFVEGQQTVFAGGNFWYLYKQSVTNLEIVRKEYDRLKNELTLQVRKDYYALIKARENLRGQAELKKEVDRIQDMVRRGYEAGAISKIELLNVTSQRGQVDFQLTSAEGDLSVTELILKQAMNVDPRMPMDIKENISFKKVDIKYDEALHAAFLNRAELKINSLMVEYYMYGKKVAKAKFWPKIDIMGNWGLAKEEYISEDAGADANQKLGQQWYAGVKGSMPFWGSTGEYSWTSEQWVPVVSAYQGTEAVTNTVKVNILDKLTTFSDDMSADIDYTRARQELNKITQDITLEVREGCFGYEKSLIQLDTSSKKVAYQESDLAFMRLKRSMDEAQDSNVVESLIKYYQEKFGHIQAITDYLTAVATVNKAIGADYYQAQDDN